MERLWKKNLDQKVHLEKKLEHFSEKKLPHPTFDQSQHRVSLEMIGYRKLETAKFGLIFVKHRVLVGASESSWGHCECSRCFLKLLKIHTWSQKKSGQKIFHHGEKYFSKSWNFWNFENLKIFEKKSENFENFENFPDFSKISFF